MDQVGERIKSILTELPASVTLVAVSKFHPKEKILSAFEMGQLDFGESHVQEMTEKQVSLPPEIRWHFIGHLQTNKVKLLAPYVSLIHAVDSLKLLVEIDKQAEACNRVIDCLLQIHVAQEETKYGFTFDECRELLASNEWKKLHHARITGLMCMASNVDDKAQILREFHEVSSFFDTLKHDYFASAPWFKEKSWGMSQDYALAIAEGSTLVRIGTKIFGQREY